MFLYALSCFMFFYAFFVGSFLFDLFLFSVGGLDASFSFVFDFLSFGFFCCVSFISGVVFLYSIFYMEGTVDSRRFVWLVFLFVLSMLLLVFSGNFFSTLIGWDGLGLVSFCLVIFYGNSSSLESGLVTVFSNRVGDVFFLISFMFFFVNGSFGWDLFCLETSFLFLVFLFFGAITKSAQAPFSAWLPAAMAAPTPVSSLVHSSTLVTAGVYVLIRFNYVFFSFSLNFLKFFFVFTMLVAGGVATLESDFKKVVAMSTLSQLGMMLFVLSVGAWVLSFLHMIIHAFFKSMLFLSTGSLMGQMTGTQDSRFYGGLFLNYFSFIYFSVSCFCLAGFPFFLGFYSKDFIIASCLYVEGFGLYAIFLLGCFFTVIYSIRLLMSAYFFSYKFSAYSFSSERFVFLFPVFMLFLKCWAVGGLMHWLFLSHASFFFTFFDLFLGLLLISSGSAFYFLLRFSYGVFYALSMIIFLRWKSSGGVSFLFSFFVYSKSESTWVEFLGGSGVYSVLVGWSALMHLFSKMGLGLLLLCSVASSFYFF